MTIRIVCPNKRCRRVLRLDAEWTHHINVRFVKCGELFTVYAKDGYVIRPLHSQELTMITNLQTPPA